jgi:hypothetical protein
MDIGANTTAVALLISAFVPYSATAADPVMCRNKDERGNFCITADNPADTTFQGIHSTVDRTFHNNCDEEIDVFAYTDGSRHIVFVPPHEARTTSCVPNTGKDSCSKFTDYQEKCLGNGTVKSSTSAPRHTSRPSPSGASSGGGDGSDDLTRRLNEQKQKSGQAAVRDQNEIQSMKNEAWSKTNAQAEREAREIEEQRREAEAIRLNNLHREQVRQQLLREQQLQQDANDAAAAAAILNGIAAGVAAGHNVAPRPTYTPPASTYTAPAPRPSGGSSGCNTGGSACR